jgi:hypothetical protein
VVAYNAAQLRPFCIAREGSDDSAPWLIWPASFRARPTMVRLSCGSPTASSSKLLYSEEIAGSSLMGGIPNCRLKKLYAA